MAVADGVSSGARADLGAAVASAVVVAYLQQALNDCTSLEGLSTQDLFAVVARHMADFARERGLEADDVSATLIAAVIPASAASDGTRNAWFGWLADPSAWQRTSNSWQRIAGGAESEPYHNRLTTVLPFHPDRARGVTLTLPANATVAIVSDGLGDAFDDVAGADGWFAQRWESPPPLASFVLDVGYEGRGCGDDRTGVVVWTEAPELGG